VNIHLIDGTYELFRAFYGAPKAHSKDGEEVGAGRGLLRSLIALLREPAVTHVAIAFDHVIESFRNDLFEGYKTGDGIDAELWSQFPLAERVAAALGIAVWPMIEFEADDALATAADLWSRDPQVERIFLCSPDKDLAQCVRGEKVVLRDRMREKIIDEAGVQEKWGVGPASIPDLLALMGDSADGIPGIPRWGQKSCAAVLSADEWRVKVRGASTLAKNLASNRESALLYKRLAILRTDVPLTETLPELEWRGADRQALEAVAKEIGATGALERVSAWR
jgi:5'-3' exonuclease